MTMTLNESASKAVAELSQALRVTGWDAGTGLGAMASVESREALGSAADMCSALALMDLDPRVTAAALHAYFVFADQAGRRPKPCVPCSSSMHFKGVVHGMATQSMEQRDLDGSLVCGCYCQRRK